MLDVEFAIGHHLIIFALFGILAAELALIRANLTPERLILIAKIDIWYGTLAAAILIVGFSRAIFAAKGWAYYSPLSLLRSSRFPRPSSTSNGVALNVRRTLKMSDERECSCMPKSYCLLCFLYSPR